MIGRWLGGAALAAVAVAAWAQDAPKSLLPPGFNTPPPPAPAPAAPAVRPPAAPASDAAPAPASPATAALPATPLLPPDVAEAVAAATDADADAQPQGPQELPDSAHRPTDIVGALDRGESGFGLDAWGAADGRLLSTLMARLDAPIASRWAEILLRRALLSRVPTPANVAAPDWVAARTAVLLRLGEADGARALVQAVDVDQFSPALYTAAADTALATADPAGLCPLSAGGVGALGPELWPLAAAMCAALSGDVADAGAPIDEARARMGTRNVDVLLPEKVIGASAAGRRAVEIDWTDTQALTPWRFGLATATGVLIPDRLYAGVTWPAAAWAARAPMLTAAERIPFARTAAALGPFSGSALVSLYAAAGEADGSADDVTSEAGRLRDAIAADDQHARISAIRSLWEEAQPGVDRYAAAILTASAAARIAPDDRWRSDAEPLLAAMLSCGHDTAAARWTAIVAGMSGARGDGAWALLAVGAPAGTVPVAGDRVQSVADRLGADGAQRARLLLAALAGLGRIDRAEAARLSQSLGAGLGQQTSWSRLIDRAGAGGQDGTVALLAAVGLQTPSWDAVPPFHLFHIVAALVRSGHEPEARMIAAEAVTRA